MIKSHPLQAHVEDGRREIFVLYFRGSGYTTTTYSLQHGITSSAPPIRRVQSTVTISITTPLQVLHTDDEGVPERPSSYGRGQEDRYGLVD